MKNILDWTVKVGFRVWGLQLRVQVQGLRCRFRVRVMSAGFGFGSWCETVVDFLRKLLFEMR